MRIRALSARSAILLSAALSMALSLSCPQPSQAEDGSLGSQIAELMYGDDAVKALKAVPIDDTTRQVQRDRMRPFVDTSSVSDRDLDTLTRVSLELTSEAVVAGLRRALANKFGEISIEHQKQILDCMKNYRCDKYRLSEEARAFMETLPRFLGKKAGELHIQIGTLMGQKMLETLRSMDPSEFDNKDELLRVFTVQPN
jgi:hypothetical protein